MLNKVFESREKGICFAGDLIVPIGTKWVMAECLLDQACPETEQNYPRNKSEVLGELMNKNNPNPKPAETDPRMIAFLAACRSVSF